MTKTITSIIIAVAMLIPGMASAYTSSPLDGSMMPIDLTASNRQHASPLLPDSLTLLHATVLSRHGARYMTSERKFDTLLQTLQQQDSSGNLSPSGKGMLALLDTVCRLSTGKWGELSPLGLAQERAIGLELASLLSPLLDAHATVAAQSTFVPRCRMTMYEILHSLSLVHPGVQISSASGPEQDTLLRSFDTYTDYADYRKSGDWTRPYDRYMDTSIPTEPFDRLFLKKLPLGHGEKARQTLQLYSVLQSLQAMGLDRGYGQWMTESQMHACWLAANLQHWLRNGITPLDSAAAPATSPLLRHIMDEADRALLHPGNAPRLNLLVGHAETLLPLLSLMRMPGCYWQGPADAVELARHWRVQDITPLGAYLLIVWSRAPSGAIYATLRLNGRTIVPAVPWTALRSTWHSYLR